MPKSCQSMGAGIAILDARLADDGQVICRPADVDLFLTSFDGAVLQTDGARGYGEGAKSIVRLVGHEDAFEFSIRIRISKLGSLLRFAICAALEL